MVRNFFTIVALTFGLASFSSATFNVDAGRAAAPLKARIVEEFDWGGTPLLFDGTNGTEARSLFGIEGLDKRQTCTAGYGYCSSELRRDPIVFTGKTHKLIR